MITREYNFSVSEAAYSVFFCEIFKKDQETRGNYGPALSSTFAGTGVAAQMLSFSFARKNSRLDEAGQLIIDFSKEITDTEILAHYSPTLFSKANCIPVIARHSVYRRAFVLPHKITTPDWLINCADELFLSEGAIVKGFCERCKMATFCQNALPCGHFVHYWCAEKLPIAGRVCCHKVIDITALKNPPVPSLKVRDACVGAMNAHLVITSMQKILRQQVTIHMRSGYRNITILLAKEIFGGWENIVKLPCPDLTLDSTYNMTFPNNSKSGIYFGKKLVDYENMCKLTQHPTKREAYPYVLLQFGNLAKKVRRAIKHGIHPAVILNKVPVVSSASVKLETKEDTSLRIFFNPSFMKFIFDKIFMLPPFHFMYNRGPVMVGFHWDRGGAYRFFMKMAKNVKFSKRFYWEWDISRFDTSHKAIMLLTVCIFLLHFYDKDKNYFNLEAFAKWSADSYAAKFVKWLGLDDWRLVIGVLFSGEYGTSMFNTLIAIMLFLSYKRYIYAVVKLIISASLLFEYLTDVVYNVYGDDGFASLPWQLRPFCSLIDNVKVDSIVILSFSNFIKQEFDIELKAAASETFDHILSTIDESTGEIKQRGPKILKRHFIMVKHRGKTQIASFKPLSSCAYKLLKPAALTSYHRQLVRCIGHLWDTQGTNLFWWNKILLHMRQIIVHLQWNGDMFQQELVKYISDNCDKPVFNNVLERFRKTFDWDELTEDERKQKMTIMPRMIDVVEYYLFPKNNYVQTEDFELNLLESWQTLQQRNKT